MTWVPVLYRDIWADDLRLRLDGIDYTYFRDALAQIGGYQLQEPFAYGPADFQLPQVTQFEVDRHGVGDLSGVRVGARAELVTVVDGAYADRVWAGFVTSISVSGDGTALHCDGTLSGRLSLRDKHTPLFEFTKDIGLMVFDACLGAGINIKPYLGPTTGLRRSNIGGGGSQLDWVGELLAGSLTAAGSQWTIARDGRGFRMRLKDFTTIHATVFLGAHGVSLDATRDLQEEPTTIYGTGTQPNGQKILNAVAPNLLSGEPAAYPFNDNRTFGIGTTDADTDTGAGIYTMHRKLVGHGLMSRAEAADNVYDDDTEDAVRALQRRAHLPRTGVMNPRTWRALFNVTATGRSLYGATVLPMAELDETQRFTLTSNGSVDEANPDYDPDRIEVDRTIDWGGGVWKKDMLKASERELDRIHSAKNWVGTLGLDGADVFAGHVTATSPSPVPMSRLDLREGMNILVRNFDGATLFHISGINVDGDGNVSAAIDTRFRDLLTVGQIIARNKESRRHPAREFINTIRRPNAMSTMITWSEIGGLLDRDQPLKGGEWNEIPIPVGQSGSVERIRIHLRSDRAAFVMAILDSNVTPSHMARVAGSNPLFAGVPAVEAKDGTLAKEAVPATGPKPAVEGHAAVPDDPSTPDVNESAPAVEAQPAKASKPYQPAEPAQPAVEAEPAIPGSKWANEHVQNTLKHDLLALYTAGQAKQPLGYYPRPHRDDQDKVTGAPITGDWEDDAGFEFRTLGSGVLYLWVFPDRDCVLQGGQLLYPNFAEGS